MKTIKNTLLVQSETDLCGVSLDGKLLWKIACPVQRMFNNSNSPVYEGQGNADVLVIEIKAIKVILW